MDVDVEALHDKEDITFGNYTLKFSNSIPPHGQVYKSDKGDEAVISYSPDTNTIIGSLMTEDGKSFALEKCGKNYIFEEFDLPDPHSTGEHYFPGPNHTLDGMEIMRAPVKIGLGSRQKGPKSYSVMFYYTPEFAKITTYIENYFDLVIEKANQGYANSQMPIVVTKFCTELMEIDENGGNFLNRFKDFKGSHDELKNTADVAALFSVGGLGVLKCGEAYNIKGKPTDWTFSVTRKSCALGGLTFHHEVGHNFGCQHDRIADAPASGDAYGHHIEAGNGHNGLRTVMAYDTAGHSQQVNYFSNPNVIHPLTGTPTGIRGKADCAGVHTKNIDYIAALGDESATCKKKCNKRAGSIQLKNYKNSYQQVVPIKSIKFDLKYLLIRSGICVGQQVQELCLDFCVLNLSLVLQFVPMILLR